VDAPASARSFLFTYHPRRSVMISKFSPGGLIGAATLLPEARWTLAIRCLWINLAITSLNRTAGTFSFSGQITSLGFGRIPRLDRPFTLRGWPGCLVIVCASTRLFSRSLEQERKARVC